MGRAIQRDDIAKVIETVTGATDGELANAIHARIRELDPCYGKAAADEPIFVLKATDDLAPEVVEWWCDLARLTLPMESKRRKGIPEAGACAVRMRRWKEAHPDA